MSVGALMLEENSAVSALRNNSWLADRVELLWENHFSDVAVGYPISPRFGTRAQYRFGSIAARSGKAVILMNRLYMDPYVPTYVVDGTLAHELAHYAHGFGSGLPRLYTHAHRGGVVDLELQRRGLGELNRRAEKWRETYWDSFYAARCRDIVARQSQRAGAVTDVWDSFICKPGNRTDIDLSGRLSMLAPRFNMHPAELPFELEWLRATRRQSGISYWFSRSRVVRIHALLTDRRVPGSVLDFEIAYWLARFRVGAEWELILAEVKSAKLGPVAEDALRWRRHAWTAFCARNHPLNRIAK